MESKHTSIREMSSKYLLCITNGSLLNTPPIPLSRGNMLQPHFSQRRERGNFSNITEYREFA